MKLHIENSQKPAVGRTSSRWLVAISAGLSLLLLASVAIGYWVATRKQAALMRVQLRLQPALVKIEQFAGVEPGNSLSLDAQELDSLIGSSTASGTPRHSFTFGLPCSKLPVQAKELTTDQAWRLRQIGAAVSEKMGGRTDIHLKLVALDAKPAELLDQGQVDFMVLPSLSAMEIHGQHPDFALVAQEAKTSIGVIFAREDTKLRELKQLRDVRVAFPDAHLTVTILAKARLVESGIYANSLRVATTYAETDMQTHSKGRHEVSQKETIARVLSGEFEAGITTQIFLDSKRARGLVVIASFPDAPRIVVARPGLPPTTIEAFRQALLSLNKMKPPAAMPPSAMMTYASVRMADFVRLSEAVKAAARFDAGAGL